jgi:hypothetical protein
MIQVKRLREALIHPKSSKGIALRQREVHAAVRLTFAKLHGSRALSAL